MYTTGRCHRPVCKCQVGQRQETLNPRQNTEDFRKGQPRHPETAHQQDDSVYKPVTTPHQILQGNKASLSVRYNFVFRLTFKPIFDDIGTCTTLAWVQGLLRTTMAAY
jgi:hypothetical protein